MRILYHGSYLPVADPLTAIGRQNVDFGSGFYLTEFEEQAKRWASATAMRKGPHNEAAVSIYQFDEDSFAKGGYNTKIFTEYNLDWLQYVVNCRKEGTLCQEYDFIEGGVANDQVIDTVEDYEMGRITAEQALGQLQFKKPNHQICIRNQEVINKYLRFTGSYIVKD